ncbi:MAG: SpaA isopeptide-forming pilin-related protein [Defluviitaleaceae bacterium]|nr:SpaA isopeptide-forming pilin-related protein [Defluviitaleaceae bacterium]
MSETIRFKPIVKLFLLIIALWLLAVVVPDTFADNTYIEQIESYGETIHELKQDLIELIEHTLELNESNFLSDSWYILQMSLESSQQMMINFDAEVSNVQDMIKNFEGSEEEKAAYDFMVQLNQLRTDLEQSYDELKAAYHALELIEIEEKNDERNDIYRDEKEMNDQQNEIDEEEEFLCDLELDEYCELIQLSMTREEFEGLTQDELLELVEAGRYMAIEFQSNAASSMTGRAIIATNEVLLPYNACPNLTADGLNFVINTIVDGTVCVQTFAQFQSAYTNNADVSRIVMMANISLTSTVNRIAPIEIDGNGRRANGSPSGNGPQGDGFVLTQASNNTLDISAAPSEGWGSLFHLHSVVINRTGTTPSAAGAAGASFVNDVAGIHNTSHGHLWRFRFGNIRTSNIDVTARDETGRATYWELPSGADAGATGSAIGRLVRAYRAETTFYGEVFLGTRSENMYTGKVLIEDHTLYVGQLMNSAYSIIWFSEPIGAGNPGTAGSSSCGNLTLPAERSTEGTGLNQTDCSNSFVVGQYAEVYLTSTAGGDFPAVFAHWRNLLLFEGARMDVSTNGPSIAFNDTPGGGVNVFPQTVRIHDRAMMLGTRRSTGMVIRGNAPGTNGSGSGSITSATGTSASNATLEVRPGGSLFVMGSNSGGPVINLESGSNNLFLIDSPYQVDLRNENTDEHSRIFGRHDGATYSFINSTVVLWENGTNTGGIANINNRFPDHVYHDVDHFTLIGGTVAGGAAATWGSNAAGTTGSNWSGITSSHPHLENMVRSNMRGTGTGTTAIANAQRNMGRFRRIALTTQDPVAYLLDAVTDADLNIRAAAMLMEVPISDGFGNAVVGGTVRWRPVHAGQDQADIWVIDSFIDPNDPQLMEIGSDGVGIWTDPNHRFQIAGEEIEVWAEGNLEYNLWIQDHRTTTSVLDVTPPTPGSFDSSTISPIDVEISGTASEIGAGVTVEIEGASLPNGRLTLSTIVTDDGHGQGSWRIDLPARENPDICHVNVLNIGYSIQVLLHDGSPTLTLEDDFDFIRVRENPTLGIPVTHLGDVNGVQIGNQNPRTGVISYRDAIGEHAFMPGPTLTVTRCLIVTFNYNDSEADNEGIFKQIGVNTHTQVEIPTVDPVREGFHFQGWTTDVAGHIPFDFENHFITDNTTLYAQWIPIVDVEFIKTDHLLYSYTEFEEVNMLEGARFNLYSWENEVSDWHLMRADVSSDANGLVRFEGLIAGSSYRLVETEAPEGFSLPEGHWYIDIETNRNVIITRSLNEAGIEKEDVPFIRRNDRWFVGNMPKGVAFSFTKTNDYLYLDADANDPTSEPNHPNLMRLAGAVFTLSRWEFDPVSQTYDWIMIEEDVISNAVGLVEFESLLTLDGSYRLDEVHAPEGFRVPHGWWLINWDEASQRFNIRADGTISLVPAFRYVERGEGEHRIVYYYVGNFPETVLPDSGGLGTTGLTLLGGLAMTFVGLFYLRFKMSDELSQLGNE